MGKYVEYGFSHIFQHIWSSFFGGRPCHGTATERPNIVMARIPVVSHPLLFPHFSRSEIRECHCPGLRTWLNLFLAMCSLYKRHHPDREKRTGGCTASAQLDRSKPVHRSSSATQWAGQW
eukprot:gene16229-biopygen2231